MHFQEERIKSLYISIAGKIFLIKIEAKIAQSFYSKLKQAFKGFVCNKKNPIQSIKITDFLSAESRLSPSWRRTLDLEPEIFKFTQSGRNLEIFASKKILRNWSLWHIFLDKLIVYLCDSILSHPDIILVHCAACAKNNKGLLFLGPSKSGKTTIAKLARDWTVLSDDRILVKQTGVKFKLYQLPLLSYESCKLQKNIQGPVVVDKIFLLRKDNAVKFKRVSKATCFAELLERQKDLNRAFQKDIKKIFYISYGMSSAIPAFKMHFRKDGSFWKFIGRL